MHAWHSTESLIFTGLSNFYDEVSIMKTIVQKMNLTNPKFPLRFSYIHSFCACWSTLQVVSSRTKLFILTDNTHSSLAYTHLLSSHDFYEPECAGPIRLRCTEREIRLSPSTGTATKASIDRGFRSHRCEPASERVLLITARGKAAIFCIVCLQEARECVFCRLRVIRSLWTIVKCTCRVIRTMEVMDGRTGVGNSRDLCVLNGKYCLALIGR